MDLCVAVARDNAVRERIPVLAGMGLLCVTSLLLALCASLKWIRLIAWRRLFLPNTILCFRIYMRIQLQLNDLYKLSIHSLINPSIKYKKVSIFDFPTHLIILCLLIFQNSSPVTFPSPSRFHCTFFHRIFVQFHGSYGCNVLIILLILDWSHALLIVYFGSVLWPTILHLEVNCNILLASNTT